MKLRIRRIQKLIEAYSRIHTRAARVYWDMYGIAFNFNTKLFLHH